MLQFTTIISIRTNARCLIDVTRSVEAWAGGHELRSGILTLLCRHTSAFFERVAPEDPSRYAHDDEGADDMPAHIRAALTGVSLAIPLVEGRRSGPGRDLPVRTPAGAPPSRNCRAT